MRVFAENRKYGNPVSVISTIHLLAYIRLISSKLRRAKQITTTTSEYKTRRRPITSSLPTSHLHPFTTKLFFATTTLHNLYTHHYPSSSPISHHFYKLPSKCLPKLPRRSPPPVARPRLARLPLRRRKLAKKTRRHLVTRRRGIRPERKLTPHTSTKVYSLQAYLVIFFVVHHPFTTLSIRPSWCDFVFFQIC